MPAADRDAEGKIVLSADAVQEFARALIARSPDVLATVPDGETFALADEKSDFRNQNSDLNSDLSYLRRYVFQKERPPERERAGDVVLFSAPGEGRECVEIARRVLREARRGVAFDEMAVLVRAPAHYLGLLEHAFERAGVPASFERGTRRPHAGGRAFLALLACAAEGLSANRFAEYLSLGQLPEPGAQTETWVAPGDELFAGADTEAENAAPPEPEPSCEPGVGVSAGSFFFLHAVAASPSDSAIAIVVTGMRLSSTTRRP